MSKQSHTASFRRSQQYPPSLQETLDIALRVMTSKRFLNREGLGNEVPYYVLRYRIEWDRSFDQSLRQMLSHLNESVPTLHIDVYQLAIQIWRDCGYWDQILAQEAGMDRQDFADGLAQILDAERVLAPAIAERIQASPDSRVVILSGVHHLFPIMRAHRLLNCLQPLTGDVPVVLTFPGSYRQSPTVGSALVLFDQVSEDNYYRAFDLLDQQYALETIKDES